MTTAKRLSMTSYRLVLTGLCILLLQLIAIPAAVAQNRSAQKKVEVNTERAGDAFHVQATNHNPFTITMTVNVDGHNFKTNNKLPATLVIGSGDSKHILTAYIKDKSKSVSFSTNYNWFMGDIYARPDTSYVYRLPYAVGKAYRVGQSYKGSFSHHGSAEYAVDFIMPVGTEVVAARAGVVVQTREDSDRGGPSESYKDAANYINIEHDDGTYGEYAHLKKNGVLVSEGQHVSKGQVIGLSGNTGYSTGPHLHFMVTKVTDGGSFKSFPITFRAAGGKVSVPEEGESYTAR